MMPPVVETTTETDVSKTGVPAETDVPAETEPRKTPEATVIVKVTVAGIAETKIKRRSVAVGWIRIITQVTGVNVLGIGIVVGHNRSRLRINSRWVRVDVR